MEAEARKLASKGKNKYGQPMKIKKAATIVKNANALISKPSPGKQILSTGAS